MTEVVYRLTIVPSAGGGMGYKNDLDLGEARHVTNDVTGIGKPRKRKYVDLLTKIDLWVTWMTVK